VAAKFSALAGPKHIENTSELSFFWTFWKENHSDYLHPRSWKRIALNLSTFFTF
jgi:hypothetical protein